MKLATLFPRPAHKPRPAPMPPPDTGRAVDAIHGASHTFACHCLRRGWLGLPGRYKLPPPDRWREIGGA